MPKIRPSIPFIAALVFTLYLGLNAWIYFYGTSILTFFPFLKKTAETVSILKQKEPCTITTSKFKLLDKRAVTPLPAGKQGWTFNHGPGITGPKIQTATVDPLTPAACAGQTVTITAKHNSPITATATLFTDTKQKTVDMKRAAGTDIDGTWKVSWIMNDTYDSTYHIDFLLKSAGGDWSGALTFR